MTNMTFVIFHSFRIRESISSILLAMSDTVSNPGGAHDKSDMRNMEKSNQEQQANNVMNPNNPTLNTSPQVSSSRNSQARSRMFPLMASRAGKLAACLALGVAMLSQSARALPSYATTVLSDNPVAFWQLADTTNPNPGPATAVDSTTNGFNGTYGLNAQNAANFIQSPQPGGTPAYNGFAANQGALQCANGDLTTAVTLPPLNVFPASGATLTNGESIVMWIEPSAVVTADVGLLFMRNGTDNAGFGFSGTLNSGGTASLGWDWDQDSATTYNYNSGLYPPTYYWSFVALVVQSNQATFYLDYLDPNNNWQPVLSSAVQTTPLTTEGFNSGTILLGADSNNANRSFPGDISGAAIFNKALTPAQILQLFGSGLGVSGFAPQITGQPQSAEVITGSKVKFSATGINGTATIGYQWQLNGVNVNLLSDASNFTGANSNILTVTSVAAADVGSYQLIATNSFGTALSSNATLTTQSAALVGQWLDGSEAGTNLQDVSGYWLATNHTAMLIGGGNILFTNDVPIGKTGQSLLFFNGDTGLAISNSSTLDADYDNTFDGVINHAFTVSVWARNFPLGWSPFVSKWGEGPPYNTPNGGWQLRAEGDGQDACWTVRDNNAGVAVLAKAGDALDDMASSGYPGNDGQWHQYTGVFDASTGVRTLYTDGQLSAQETGNVAYDLAPYSHVCIGAKDSAPGNSFGNFATNNLELYDVRIYNYAVTQNFVLTNLVGNLPPTVGTQPANKNGLPGRSVSIFATSSGTPPLNYTWLFNGVNINLLPDSTNYSGINSNVLTILSMSANEAGSYQMAVTNTYGGKVSSNAIVSLQFPYLVGEWFTNSSLADKSGYQPAGTHDGYDSVGNGGYGYTNDVPAGRPGASLVLGGTTSIAIMNSATSDAAYTNTFDDTIHGNMTVAFWAKGWPGGWQEFVSKNGDSGSPNAGWNVRNDGNNNVSPCWTMRGAGGTVTLGTAVYGNGEDLAATSLTYGNDHQWHHYAGTYNAGTGIKNLYVDGVLAGSAKNLGSYNLAAYSHFIIGGFEASPGGTFNNFFTGEFYDVRVYNYDLTSNQVQVLAALPDPLITLQPSSATAYLTGKVVLTASTKGTAPMTNQWQLNGTNLVDGSYGGAYITGSTSNVLTIIDLTGSLQGVYDMVLSNPNGTTVSSNATLTVVSTVAPPAGTVVGAWLTGAASLADVSGYQPAHTHDGYGVNGAGVLSSSYTFTNDVPPGATGSNSLFLYAGNTAIAITNSSTLDGAYTNTFDDTISNSFTVTCWAKGSLGAWNSFVTKSGDSGTGWALREGGSGGTGCWTVRGSGGTEDMQASVKQTDGKWHFYAGTYDLPSGIRSLYVDGVLEAQQINQVGYTPSTAHLAFGSEDLSPGNNFGNNGYFKGEIYGVQIYKTALSVAQINSIIPPVPIPVTPAKVQNPVLNGNQLVFTWTGSSLLEATNILGPWTPVAGATSPYTNNVTASQQLFFKASQ